jgi:CDP-glucose 4,6-dehydratase
LYSRLGREGKIKEAFIDVRDYPNLNSFVTSSEPSAIIHLAAQPLVLQSYENPLATFETNVMGTANILDCAFSSASVRAIIISTTDKVYKNEGERFQFIESDALSGKDPYSASKVGAESAIAAWQQIRKINGGPRVTSVRAGNVIGGGDLSDNRIIPDLVRAFKSQQQAAIRNPNSTRPWQHVLDPLNGYLQVLKASLEGVEIPSLNFGPKGNSLSVSELVRIARQIWPEATNVEFETSSNQTESETLNLNSEAAFKLLSWKPAWSQEDAIESTMRWWRKVLIDDVPPIDACKSDIAALIANE